MSDEAMRYGSRSVERGMGLNDGFGGENLDAVEKLL